ncbi:MAG: dihydroneopterin aldolase [Alcanivoracaceae bacterium]|nr:dihydroneopterin aldolase [Alcanivoracaceae bacterium]
MDTIFIQQLTVETIIGVYPREREIKQTLIVDIEMQYESAQASASDNLKHALDYHQICKDIHAFIGNSSFHLIEALADAIANRILKNKKVRKINLTLSKPQALDQAKNVGIRISRTNN